MSKGLKFVTDFIKMSKSTRKGGYDKWIPDKLRVISGGEGSLVCELTIDQDLVNESHTLHDGCTATIVDVVSMLALMTFKPIGVSVDLNVAYLSAAKLGDVIVVIAKNFKSDQNLAFFTVDIKRKADGQVIALGRQTLFIGQKRDRNFGDVL